MLQHALYTDCWVPLSAANWSTENTWARKGHLARGCEDIGAIGLNLGLSHIKSTEEKYTDTGSKRNIAAKHAVSIQACSATTIKEHRALNTPLTPTHAHLLFPVPACCILSHSTDLHTEIHPTPTDLWGAGPILLRLTAQQSNSCLKGPLEVCGPASCSEHGQQWDQDGCLQLYPASSCKILRKETAWPPCNLFQWLVALMVKAFSLISRMLWNSLFSVSIVSHPLAMHHNGALASDFLTSSSFPKHSWLFFLTHLQGLQPALQPLRPVGEVALVTDTAPRKLLQRSHHSHTGQFWRMPML